MLAIGAFVGDTDGTKCDVPFYRIAREHLTMDVLEKGSLSYVQALTLTANYLQKRNKPNSGFVLIGIGFSMALAIGLHREFSSTNASPFTMELRRRVWWTLFIFVSGAQLTLGRPAVSLVGVNVRLPSNLDDEDLAVDIERLPKPNSGPTTSSCLIEQVKLAKVANIVQTELLTNQIPSMEEAVHIDRMITQWREVLPAYFDEGSTAETWFEVPKRILIWRSFHLRIVLNRPILFENITARAALSMSVAPINACLTAAEDCVNAICTFIESPIEKTRGLAWYATYWLITASFVQATCYVYDPGNALSPVWKAHLTRAVGCLTSLGTAHGMAFRARDILQKLLGKCQAFILETRSFNEKRQTKIILNHSGMPLETPQTRTLRMHPWISGFLVLQTNPRFNLLVCKDNLKACTLEKEICSFSGSVKARLMRSYLMLQVAS